MGRNRNRRDRPTRNDDVELPSSLSRFHRWNPSVKPPLSHQSGSPPPLVDDGKSSFNKDNPFHRHRERLPQPQQHRLSQPWHQNDRGYEIFLARPPREIPFNIFLQKSQRLKQNLIRTLDQALSQIEQWYPDMTADGDLMEWQPEKEILIPQSDQTVYTYGLPVGQKRGYERAENEVLECRLEAAPSTRRRAASDAGMSRTAGRLAAEELWNGPPGRFPECVLRIS